MIYYSNFGGGPVTGITLVGVGTPVHPSGAGASPSYPAGLASGDVAVLTVLCTDQTGGGPVVNTPDGWDLFYTVPGGNIPAVVYGYGAQFWKRLDGSESGTVAITVTENTGSGHVCAVIEVFRGVVASGTPLEGGNSSKPGGSSTHTGSTPTTTNDNSVILTHFLTGNSAATGTPNGDAAEIFEVTDAPVGDLDVDFAGYSLLQETAGAGVAISRAMTDSVPYMQLTSILIPA